MPSTSYQPKEHHINFKTWALPGQAPSVIYNTNTISSFGKVCVRQTTNNPSWRTNIAKHLNANYSYLVERVDAKVVTGLCTAHGIGSGTGRTAYWKLRYVGAIPNTYPNSNTALCDRALTSLKRRVSRRVGGVKAMVPVAESRELRGLVRQAVTMTTTLVDTLIDIKRTKGASALKYASSAWLAYGFGVRPLVDDIQNTAKAINSYLNRDDVGIRDFATAKDDWVTYSTVTSDSSTAGCYFKTRIQHHHMLSYRWYCGGYTSVHSSNDYGVLEHLGFSMKELIPTFWELVPYSWVVDYFGNVGSVLEDTFQVLPVSYVYTGYTRRYECKMLVTHSWLPENSLWVLDTNQTASAEVKRFEFERVPQGTTLPSIGLRFKMLDEIGYFGVNKLLNLASVLIQRKL